MLRLAPCARSSAQTGPRVTRKRMAQTGPEANDGGACTAWHPTARGNDTTPQVLRGLFCEFQSERVISRPGQPIPSVVGLEIGSQISREVASGRWER